MTKKIIKYTLCTIALFGITVSFWFIFSLIPSEQKYNQLNSQLFGFSSKVYFPLTHQQSNALSPYNYINIPKTNDIPLVLSLFFDGDEALKGQDQTNTAPDTQTPPDTPSDTNSSPPTPLPENTFPVIALDLSEKQSLGNLSCKNESKYDININELAENIYPISYTKTISTNSQNEPVVLIVHSHGTECYLPDNTTTYTKETPTRTQNTDINVVAVGKTFADILNQKGISTIHCTTMFDKDSYSESYNLSEKAVQNYIKQYPTIQYVFDIHRDSIMVSENEKAKALSTINGLPTAQAMLVVGTDSGGANHPNWIDNLTVASIFQYGLIKDYSTLMRPINVRAASFNAEHAPGSVLIEIGTCGNTVTEAQNCAKLLAETIGNIIVNDGIK